MKFSIWPSPERSWIEVRDLARYAERSVWQCLWYADHFMPNSPTDEITDGSVHECWSVISALAATTSRLRLGSLVSPTTVHHPAVLANVAATVDRISDGRLTLGLGAGWQVNEHRAYGIDLFSPKDRVDRFEEAIQIIRSLLGNERTTFSGRHFHVDDAPCRPAPIQDPLPLLVGTGGPRMSVITARHADRWNTWGNVAEAGRRLRTIDDACATVGREPTTLHRSVQALFFRVDDQGSADRLREAAPADRSIIGNADALIEALRAYQRLGFDEVIVPDFTLGRDAAERLDSYLWFESDVLPHV